MTATVIRFTVTTVASVPHAVANTIHAVAPRLRSRYTVHAVAVSMLSVGLKMDHNEHEVIHWVSEHTPGVVSFLIDFVWGPLGELLKGVGVAPYLDGVMARTLKEIAPEEKK